MPNLINTADFIGGQNNIPNLDIQGTNLQKFIDKYEPIFLECLLGSALYDAYIATPTDARFEDLVGKTWFKPAIVDFIYWYYLEDQAIINGGTGAQQAKKQNADTVSPYPKMVRAWNEMVEYNKKTNKFLKDNETIYPEYKPVVLPRWYYWDGVYLFFEWGWYYEYGCKELPEIYRIKNSLGI